MQTKLHELSTTDERLNALEAKVKVVESNDNSHGARLNSLEGGTKALEATSVTSAAAEEPQAHEGSIQIAVVSPSPPGPDVNDANREWGMITIGR